jgi:hypothetical protein
MGQSTANSPPLLTPPKHPLLSRMTEVAFVQALRSFGGSHIGTALQLPELPWTLGELGRHASLGRKPLNSLADCTLKSHRGSDSTNFPPSQEGPVEPTT